MDTANILRRVDWVVMAGAGVAIGSVVVSLVASTNWLSDLLTNFYAHIVVLSVPTVVYLFVRRRYWPAGLLTAAATFAAIPVVPFIVGSHPGVVDDGPAVRIVSTNVLYDNPNVAQVIAEIRELDADVVAVHEVTPEWADELSALDDAFGYQLCAPQQGTYGQCVFSTVEMTGDMIEFGAPGFPTFVGTAEFGDAELTVSSIHGAFPSLGTTAGTDIRNAQFADLGELLAGSDSCAVVVGDFNTVPTNPVLRDLNSTASLSFASLGTGYGNSWSSRLPGWLAGLRIDHALVSDEVEVLSHEFVDITGSDHKAVVVDLRLPTSPAASSC